MKKIEKLRMCNRLLLVVTLVVLVSGIQLEVMHCSSVAWVWVHVAVGCVLMGAVAWHLYLHFRWKSWVARLRMQKSVATRWLAVFCVLTLATGTASVIHWMATCMHAPIGGVHGKLGFVFVAIAIVHTIRNWLKFRLL